MLLQDSTTTNGTLPSDLLRRRMILVRVLEDQLQVLCNTGELSADLHFSKGQEAISVGVCAALRETDYVVTHHRSIAHAVARGVPLSVLIAEIAGKRSGMNGGIAGEMHMSYPPKRFMFSWQLVGTCVPVAAGMAWAVKYHQKTDDVVVCFHGDAATANGQWHEGVNLAAVQRLPLLLVCENNHLAGNVRPEYYVPSDVKTRGAGYPIGVTSLNTSDASEIQRAAADIVSFIRRYPQPWLLDCGTVRLGKHKQGQGDLRSKEEMQGLMALDPLRDITPGAREPFEVQVQEVIDRVMADPYPEGSVLT